MKNKATSRYADELIMGYSTLVVHLYNCMYWWGSWVESLQSVWMMTVMTALEVAGLKMYQSLNKILSRGLDTCALPQRDWIARGLMLQDGEIIGTE